MQPTTENQKQALQNALNNFNISFNLHVKISEDRRKADRFFLMDHTNRESVSPVLDYNQMNHFILGVSEGIKLAEMKAKSNGAPF